MEKTYQQLSPTAKKGLNKFARMPSSKMYLVAQDYKKKTGRNPNNVEDKERFFRFVARWKWRRK